MLTLEYYGSPKTWQRITPGDTMTTIDKNVWFYREHFLKYDSGGTTEVADGDIIRGNTSSAYAIVISKTTDSGTWAGGDAAGVLRIKSVVGTFQDNETINVAGNSNLCTVDGTLYDVRDSYMHKNKHAKAVLIQAETQAQRVMFDANAAKPDQTKDLGLYLSADASILITEPKAMENIKTLDATSGQAGSLNIIGFF